jgi:hypothetical protein
MAAFTFNSGDFYLIVPALNQSAPQPRPATGGQWVHIPYGGNRYEWDGSFEHTVWSPQGGIKILDATSYSLFAAKYGRFATLTTPWGTFSARLASFDQMVPYDDGSYRGPVTFEWTT